MNCFLSDIKTFRFNKLRWSDPGRKKRLKNDRVKSNYVSGKLVKAAIVEPFFVATEKLLTDDVKTIANRVARMSLDGCSVSECKCAVADQISSYIRKIKAEGKRVLRDSVQD